VGTPEKLNFFQIKEKHVPFSFFFCLSPSLRIFQGLFGCPFFLYKLSCNLRSEKGKEGRREGGKEGRGKEGRREGGKEGRREGGKEGRREEGKEGRREGGKEERREGGRMEGGKEG
jgi:hypothetical protein